MVREGLLVWAVAIAAAGCGQDEPLPGNTTASETYAGALSGTDALVAIVRNGPDWLAYVCGGPATQAELTGWFEGRVAGDSPVLRLASTGSASVTASFVAGSITGTLDDETASHAFQAEQIEAEPGEVVGLFGALDAGCRTGLVVMPGAAGAPARMQGVWCDASGRVGQVTPIVPLGREPRGVAVRVGHDERLLYLQPAFPFLF